MHSEPIKVRRMPTETRQLVFTNEEIMAAMTSHNRIAAEKLFVGSIVQCRLAADTKVSLHLTIRHETTRHTYDLVFGPDALEPALIRYCLELNIPLPRKADKMLSVSGGCIAMTISLHTSA